MIDKRIKDCAMAQWDMVLPPLTVYAFLYNSDCCESSASTISLHLSEEGANTAMTIHKNNIKKEWEEECKDYLPFSDYSYDFDKWWGVEEMKVLP